MRYIIAGVVGSGLLSGLAAADIEPAADADWPAWVVREEVEHARIAAVNEGDLTFLTDEAAGLTAEAKGRPHHHQNRLVISESSLLDGWVKLHQCHRRLDRVAEAQILFRPGRSRHLAVTRSRNIEAAYPEGNTIQVRGVGDDSELCLEVETQALSELTEGVYELSNGPFMRRFLDGYYPMVVSLHIAYPAGLSLADYAPAEQPGFDIRQGRGWVSARAVFEGRLRTRFLFLSE